MEQIRTIERQIKATPTLEGAGVRLKRGFGFNDTPLFDPFLMLDDFHSSRQEDYIKGFPWHPHRGIETITYVLHGEVEHGDSLGNRGIIRSGDIQWMTAGSGIVHQEMPHGDVNGLMRGFQLWANLPASQKMMEPRYREITKEQIPEVILESGVRVKIVCGRLGDRIGPVTDIVIEPEYLDVSIPPETEFVHPVNPEHTVAAYVFEGRGVFGPRENGPRPALSGQTITNETTLLFGAGNKIRVASQGEPVRFLLLSGKPIGEPIAWQGPIVMNTREELRQAFEEYRRGTFIKSKVL